MSKSVDMFVNRADAIKWCKHKCYNRITCAPNFFLQAIFSILDIRVQGNMPTYECPIILRGNSGKNYQLVEGTGDCGYTKTENKTSLSE